MISGSTQYPNLSKKRNTPHSEGMENLSAILAQPVLAEPAPKAPNENQPSENNKRATLTRSIAMHDISAAFVHPTAAASSPEGEEELSEEEVKKIDEELATFSVLPIDETIWLEAKETPEENENRTLILNYLRVLEESFAQQSSPSRISIFSSELRPSFSIETYYKHLEKYLELSPIDGIFTLLVLNRFIERDDKYRLDAFNLNRLLLTCVGLSSKFLDDKPFDNASVAWAGGVPLREYNVLELNLAKLVNFDFFAYFTLENYQQLRGQLKALLPEEAPIYLPENLNPLRYSQSCPVFFQPNRTCAVMNRLEVAANRILGDLGEMARGFSAPVVG